MLVKLVITFAASVINFTQALRNLAICGTIGSKRGRFCNFSIPMPGPGSVGLAQSRLPGKHRFAKLDADCIAEKPQNSFRIFQHVFCINNRWNRFRAIADKIKNLCLLCKAEVLQRRVVAFFNI